MAFEQAGEMARGDPEFFRQCGDRAMLQRAAVDQFQRAKPRQRVRRFVYDSQKGERIFDVCRFRKPDAAELAKRNSMLA